MNAPASVEQSMSVRVRAVAPGTSLALIIGGAALELQRLCPPGWRSPTCWSPCSSGSLVVNSPLAKWLGVGGQRSRAESLWGRAGLRWQDGLARLRGADGAADRGAPVRVAAAAGDRPGPADGDAGHLLRDAGAGDPAAGPRVAGRPRRLGDDGLRRLGRQRRGAGHRGAPAGAGGGAGHDLPLQRGRPGAVSRRSRPRRASTPTRGGSGAAWR